MDAKRWDDWALLFTADAVLTTAGVSVHARQPIADMVRGSMEGIPSSQQAFLPEIILTSDVTATGIWACTFIQFEGRTTGVGHHYETHEKVDGRWLIAFTDLRTTFVQGRSSERAEVELTASRALDARTGRPWSACDGMHRRVRRQVPEGAE